MNRRDIVISLIILGFLAVIIFRLRTPKTEEQLVVPQTLSVEDTIEQRFNLQIPEDVEKAELTDVSGGNASAIATRKFENGTFTHTILADLPDPEEGTFYEGWLIKEGSVISSGRLNIAKGGYLLEYQSNSDLSSYNQVVVTLEKTADSTPEQHVLEGSF